MVTLAVAVLVRVAVGYGVNVGGGVRVGNGVIVGRGVGLNVGMGVKSRSKTRIMVGAIAPEDCADAVIVAVHINASVGGDVRVGSINEVRAPSVNDDAIAASNIKLKIALILNTASTKHGAGAILPRFTLFNVANR